jgi:hypothetical protein
VSGISFFIAHLAPTSYQKLLNDRRTKKRDLLNSHLIGREDVMLWSVLLLTLSASVALGEDLNERFYQSIRNDDLVTLRTLVKENGASKADSRGQTSLMLAAAIKK